MFVAAGHSLTVLLNSSAAEFTSAVYAFLHDVIPDEFE